MQFLIDLATFALKVQAASVVNMLTSCNTLDRTGASDEWTLTPARVEVLQ